MGYRTLPRESPLDFPPTSLGEAAAALRDRNRVGHRDDVAYPSETPKGATSLTNR